MPIALCSNNYRPFYDYNGIEYDIVHLRRAGHTYSPKKIIDDIDVFRDELTSQAYHLVLDDGHEVLSFTDADKLVIFCQESIDEPFIVLEHNPLTFPNVKEDKNYVKLPKLDLPEFSRIVHNRIVNQKEVDYEIRKFPSRFKREYLELLKKLYFANHELIPL